MAVYEIAFDVILTHHEWIEAEDECEAEELAQRLVKTSFYEDVLVKEYERDLARDAYVDVECVCPESNQMPSINVNDYLKEA